MGLTEFIREQILKWFEGIMEIKQKVHFGMIMTNYYMQ